MSVDSFGAKDALKVDGISYAYYRLGAVPGQEKLPFSLKILLENLLRAEDGVNVTKEDIAFLGDWDAAAEPDHEIQFTPARVIMAALIYAHPTQNETLGEAAMALAGKPLHNHG